MQASLDFGNSFGKMGFFEKNELVNQYKGKNKDLLKILKEKKPDRIIACSVVHSKSELERFLCDFNSVLILDQHTKIPITNLYETKSTLGYDRLAAAVGANFLFPNQNSLILDLGTAVKYDFINSDGEFLGGMIGPGLKMRFKALHTFTKKLPLVEADKIPNLIGKNTVECIKSGVINGMLAEINGLINKYQELFEDVQIILSGGDSPFFEKQIKRPYFAAPYLVLQGLNCINTYNE